MSDADPVVDAHAGENIPYAPLFPLDGFTPLQRDFVLIPGRSSMLHLCENLALTGLKLAKEDIAVLNKTAGEKEEEALTI